jgi:hypothetical protein
MDIRLVKCNMSTAPINNMVADIIHNFHKVNPEFSPRELANRVGSPVNNLDMVATDA